MLKKSKFQEIKEKFIHQLSIPLKKIYLPGMEGNSLFDVLYFFLKALNNGLITTRAYALAFRFFMALFPALIFLFNLIPYLPISGVKEQILMLLREILPPELDEFYVTIEDLLTNQRSGLLSFGFFLTLYLALNGIEAMIGAFQGSFNIEKKLPPIKLKLKALVLLFILALLFILTGVLLISAGFIIDFIHSLNLIDEEWIILAFQLARWFTIVFSYIAGISAIYYFGHVRKIKWRIFSPGSIFATFASILASTGFAFYVSTTANYNKVYGSLGFIIILMLWIYINSLILLVGFELNASIYKAKDNQTIKSS